MIDLHVFKTFILKSRHIIIVEGSLRDFRRSFNVLYLLLTFRPDGIGTVTVEEKEHFEEIKERLRVLLENQITHFR